VTEKPVFDETATPSQNPDVDVESLSETPSSDEFFLYSRIDGQTTVQELCSRSGLGRDATIEALERLAEVGLVEVPGHESDEPETTTDEERSQQTHDGLDLSYLPTPPESFEFPEELLELDVPLDERKRREVICLHEQLDALNHFEFFGLKPDADRGDVKRAYFELSKRFHPDKHFRKELGPYNEMLERIFQEITKVHRILSNPERRKAYEAELEEASASQKETGGATPMSHDDDQGPSDDVGDTTSDADTKSKKNAAFAQLVRKAKGSARSGDYEKATEHYRKALSLKRDADVAMQAARLLKQTRQHREEAMLFARAAIRIDDEHIEARMLLGDLLEEMGRTDEAMAVYREVRELDRDHRDANRRLDTLADSSH
jgi:tetratricopeptide (TPR) repeat protein